MKYFVRYWLTHPLTITFSRAVRVNNKHVEQEQSDHNPLFKVHPITDFIIPGFLAFYGPN